MNTLPPTLLTESSRKKATKPTRNNSRRAAELAAGSLREQMYLLALDPGTSSLNLRQRFVWTR